MEEIDVEIGGFNMNKIVERRLEFLKMEGLGFSLCEIVKALSVKYQKTERTIYYDAETRKTWQPLFTQLFDLDKARLVVMNRYEWIYREAAKESLLGKDKTSALRIMLEVSKNLVNLLGLESIKQTQHQEEVRKEIKQETAKLLAMFEKVKT